MSARQRRWLGVSSVTMIFAVVGVSALWIRGWETPSTAMLVQQEPPYESLPRLDESGVRVLLDDLALDRDALVALSLSSQQAENVLAAVRSEQLSNGETLAGLRATIAQRKTALRSAEQAVAQGPAGGELTQTLTTAREDLASVKSAYQQGLSSVRSAVNDVLTESQRSAWTAIQSGHGRTMPMRMLDLSDGQRVALGKAERHLRWTMSAASTNEERSAAASAFEQSRDQILTTDQRTTAQNYISGYAASSAVVADAFALVLPQDQEP